MRVGLSLEEFDAHVPPARIGEEVARLARRADEAGLASLWVNDHFLQVPHRGGPQAPLLEAFSVLNYVAALTSRIELGVLVCAVPYRPPAVLVKMVSSLDVLSSGRAWLGVGAGWYEEEAYSLGLPFPELPVRYELLEETIHVALAMWSGRQEPYLGQHFRLARPLDAPGPVRRPHPRILIGGGGERHTLRLVALYADACNLWAGDLDRLARKLAVLRAHCDEVGRPYEQIEKTALLRLALARQPRGDALTVQAAIDRLAPLDELGIGHVMVSLAGPFDQESVDLLGEVAKGVAR